MSTLLLSKFLKELQVSLSIRCLIFKVLSALRVSVRAFLLYHTRFALSSTFSDFFKFFSKSFSFLTAPRLRQPYYCITSSSLCQELFSSFFKIFFVPASLRPPSRASSFPSFGRLSALFRRRLSATALLFYHTCEPMSSVFFGFLAILK